MQSILEIVPPPLNWTDSEIRSYANQVSETLQKLNIKDFCIPEVVEEDREGVRTIPFSPKMDPYEFFSLLPEHSSLKPTLYKVSVLMSKSEFAHWIGQMHERGIRKLVIVGGGRHDKVYPGYSVAEAVKWIKSHYPDIKVGAMCIFSRAKEEQRIMDKIAAGIDFFYSQIIFETTSAKLILSSISERCQKERLSFPPFYLSLAVAAAKEDIYFMKWLGVEFPSAVSNYLLDQERKTLKEKAEEVNRLLGADLISWKKKKQLPIFFKVEHIIYNNLSISADFFQILQKLEREA